jgi:hypothetical protein
MTLDKTLREQEIGDALSPYFDIIFGLGNVKGGIEDVA